MDDASELGKRLAARRRMKPGRCPVCGTPFESIARKVYCSSRCTLKAWRARQKERRPPPAEGENDA